jgi:hypothetical protein
LLTVLLEFYIRTQKNSIIIENERGGDAALPTRCNSSSPTPPADFVSFSNAAAAAAAGKMFGVVTDLLVARSRPSTAIQ